MNRYVCDHVLVSMRMCICADNQLMHWRTSWQDKRVCVLHTHTHSLTHVQGADELAGHAHIDQAITVQCLAPCAHKRTSKNARTHTHTHGHTQTHTDTHTGG